MKIAIAILLLISFSTGCEKHPFVSLSNYSQNKVIAIQPFGDFDDQQLAFIRNGISTFFHAPVVVLHPISIPAAYRSVKEEQYSADSLIMLLLQLTNDTIADIAGITHEDIYTLYEYKAHDKNAPSVLYEPRDIFGYGYVSGNSCVVSDYRLKTYSRELLNNRLLKVLKHEIGHNLGLPHCSNDTCIMYEGDIYTLDKCNGNFCDKCRRALN